MSIYFKGAPIDFLWKGLKPVHQVTHKGNTVYDIRSELRKYEHLKYVALAHHYKVSYFKLNEAYSFLKGKYVKQNSFTSNERDNIFTFDIANGETVKVGELFTATRINNIVEVSIKSYDIKDLIVLKGTAKTKRTYVTLGTSSDYNGFRSRLWLDDISVDTFSTKGYGILTKVRINYNISNDQIHVGGYTFAFWKYTGGSGDDSDGLTDLKLNGFSQHCPPDVHNPDKSLNLPYHVLQGDYVVVTEHSSPINFGTSPIYGFRNLIACKETGSAHGITEVPCLVPSGAYVETNIFFALVTTRLKLPGNVTIAEWKTYKNNASYKANLITITGDKEGKHYLKIIGW